MAPMSWTRSFLDRRVTTKVARTRGRDGPGAPRSGGCMRGCASVNERRAGRAQVAARGRVGAAVAVAAALGVAGLAAPAAAADVTWFVDAGAGLDAEGCGERSEERRVGTEGRYRVSD